MVVDSTESRTAGDRVRQVRHEDHLDHRSTDAVEVKNRVQFGPIIAGVLTAIATLLILTVLGLAIGASALEPRDAGETLGGAAAIWGHHLGGAGRNRQRRGRPGGG